MKFWIMFILALTCSLLMYWGLYVLLDATYTRVAGVVFLFLGK